MRTLILTLIAAGGLVLGGSAPAFAAAPNVSSYTQTTTTLTSTSQPCGSWGRCEVVASTDSLSGSAVVCFRAYDVLYGGQWADGCSSVDPSVLTLTRDGATVPPTDLSVYNELDGTTSDLTVSAADVRTGDPAVRSVSHSGGKTGPCMGHSTAKGVSYPVAGTLTLTSDTGTAVYQESGAVVVDTATYFSKVPADFTCP